MDPVVSVTLGRFTQTESYEEKENTDTVETNTLFSFYIQIKRVETSGQATVVKYSPGEVCGAR